MQVQSAQARPKEWTLLFYNAGSNDEGMMCTANLLDLERVGSDENTDVVCLNYRSGWLPERLLGKDTEFVGARTYHVTKNPEAPQATSEPRRLLELARTSPSAIRSPELERLPAGTNMADPATLKKFLLDNMNRFPAKRYALVMSGHGSGFAGQAIVHQPDGRKVMSNEQLGRALREVAEETGKPLDVINLNTCYGAGLEVLHPLREGARHAVASEGVVFGHTQPFGDVLAGLQRDLKAGKDVDGAELSRRFVEESHNQQMSSLATATLSAFDLKGILQVGEAVGALHEAVMTAGVPPETVREALKDSLKFDYSGVPRLVHVTDLVSFAEKLAAKAPQVAEQAGRVKESILSCRIAEQHEAPENDTPFTRLLRLPLRKPETSLAGLGGLSLHYDADVNAPGNRLKQIKDTEFGQAVGIEKFLTYVSQASDVERANRPAYKRALESFDLKLTAWQNKLEKKVGVPLVVPLGLKAAEMGATLGASALLGHLGVPVAEIFGAYFTGLAAWQMGSAVKDAAGVDELDRAGKRQLIESAGQVMMGAGMGAFGLTLMGVLPQSAVWPAVGVALAGRAGKLAGKLFV